MKRFEFCEKNLPKERVHVFDLFCDHGHHGERCLGLGHQVTFNDAAKHLMAALKSRLSSYSETDVTFSQQKAQELILPPRAYVFLLGVGGHLLVDCLKSWERQHCLEGRSFIAIPSYYTLELREVLKEMGATLLKEDFAWEKGRGYECFSFTFSKESPSVEFPLFNFGFWKKAYEEDKRVRTYLKKRAKNLEKKRKKSLNESKFLEELKSLLSLE